jgi:hypothetical protein
VVRNFVGISIGLLLALLTCVIDETGAESTNTLAYTSGRRDIVWGNATNGIRAGVEIFNDYRQHHGDVWSPIQVDVFLMRSDLPSRLASTNGPIFWGATNSFCGPIELREPDGQTMRPSQTNTILPECYPEILNMRSLDDEFRRKLLRYKLIISFPAMPGSHGTAFLYDANRLYLLDEFYLNDYFHLGQNVQYRLTVLPKIYRQSPTNEDLYLRIDLPAVTVPIQWSSLP